ncbi:MAG: serine/threonine-protein kinase [Bacteroidota bacterium]
MNNLRWDLSPERTGSSDFKEYERLRKVILSLPSIEKLVPRFVKVCRTHDEFWTWIKNEAPDYAGRRAIITEAINPILEVVEYEQDNDALEFQRNYEEKELIGKGGFGMVYRFEHKLLKLPFAVKIFAPAFYKAGEDSKELERFFQESRMLFALEHPNIIKIYDAGIIGKRPFIRMEYFDGLNLNELLSRHGRINPIKAATMMKAMVSAMEHAHKRGIVHRDLKPSNVMAAPVEKFRIIDFGMGIFVENELYSRLTKTGEGTVSGYYTAPELLENPKMVDPRSDIYSLGALWFTALTGRPPAGTSFIDQLKDIDGLPGTHIETIRSCLSDLSSRTKSCTELLRQMAEAS